MGGLKHLQEKFKKGYWICNACAEARGGKHPGGVGTCMEGTCPYCDGANQVERALSPWVDYNWPGDKVADGLAKTARD